PGGRHAAARRHPRARGWCQRGDPLQRPVDGRPGHLASRSMRIGIITGSGTYALPDFEDARPVAVTTPFGEVTVTEGRFAGVDVVHVSRHLPGRPRLSHQVTHQANISAL